MFAVLVNPYFPTAIIISLKTVFMFQKHLATEGTRIVCPALLNDQGEERAWRCTKKANRPNKSPKDSRGTGNEHRGRELAVD